MTLTDQLAPMLDGSDYPQRWSEYVGQDRAKDMLQVAAQSARIRKAPLDHVLIAHPTPGIGKTALALLVAREMRRPVRVLSGQLDGNGARLLFSDMDDRDVLFYDEFHQVMDGGKRRAEWMLTYLQDGTLPGPFGAEVQPKVTIIAATTDAGRLPKTIADRFLIQPDMTDYSHEDAVKIAQKLAGKVLGTLPKLTPRDAEQIAAAGHGNPRHMRKLLVVLRDMTLAKRVKRTSAGYDITALLEWSGITADGLDRVAQTYLRALATEFKGQAGAKALEDRLGAAGGLEDTERMLMDKGLVARTRTGRVLTQDGIRRVRTLVA